MEEFILIIGTGTGTCCLKIEKDNKNKIVIFPLLSKIWIILFQALYTAAAEKHGTPAHVEGDDDDQKEEGDHVQPGRGGRGPAGGGEGATEHAHSELQVAAAKPQHRRGLETVSAASFCCKETVSRD